MVHGNWSVTGQIHGHVCFIPLFSELELCMCTARLHALSLKHILIHVCVHAHTYSDTHTHHMHALCLSVLHCSVCV